MGDDPAQTDAVVRPAGSMDAGGLLRLARAVVEDIEVDAVLRRVLESARELTGARYAAVGVLDESRTGLARFISSGVDDETIRRIGALPRGLGVLGELISNPVPLRLTDVSEHPRSYGFPPEHPAMRSFLGVPVPVAHGPYGNLYLAEKRDGAQFTARDEEAVVLLAEFASVAIEHARLYERTEKRRSALEEKLDTLEASLAIARMVAEGVDLDVVLDLAVKRGRALVRTRALLIQLRRDRELVIAAGAGELPPGLIGRRLSLADTVSEVAMQTGQTLTLADAINSARFRENDAGRFGLSSAQGLVVPLVTADGAAGVLVALDPLDASLTFAEERRLLEGFAGAIAMAVAATQAAANARRRLAMAVAEGERVRWARELHDETLQALGNIRLALVAARREGEADALASAIDDAVEQLQADIDTLRALITNLRSAALEDLGVEAAVTDLARRLEPAGLEVDLRIDLDYEQGRAAERHTPGLETAIYRIVQESLTNARKHGDARQAVVEIAEGESVVRIAVADDGTGFEPSVRSSGFGLLGMSERIDMLGGTLSVESAPGRGTRITASLPVASRDPAADTRGPRPETANESVTSGPGKG